MGDPDHWNSIYKTKSSDELSWFQDTPTPSLAWIKELVPDLEAPVIDVGGGDSVLIDALLQAGYARPTVLDISQPALARAQSRLGEQSSKVSWIQADILQFRPPHSFALWHDRALFHFLTSSADRERYVKTLRLSLAPAAKIIVATFSPDGPSRCSGLDIVRFDEEQLSAELGRDFQLSRSIRVKHTPPLGRQQDFMYCLFEAQF